MKLQVFLNIKHFYGLEMKTSPGLGCISFPRRFLVEMSINLTRPERKGRTIKIRIEFTPLHQPVIKREQPWAPTPLPAFSLCRDPPVGSILGRKTIWSGALGFWDTVTPSSPLPSLMGSRKSLGDCCFSRQGGECGCAVRGYFYI